MFATDQAERAGLLDGGYVYRSGPPADWDRLIRSLVIWGLAFVALLCGLVAAFSVFGRQREVEILSARTDQVENALSSLNDVRSRIAILERRPTFTAAELAESVSLVAKVENVEKSFADLSQTLNRSQESNQINLARIDGRVDVIDERISHLDLRLTSPEALDPKAAAPQGENVAKIGVAPPAALPSPQPQTRLKRFSVLRADEGGAWIVAPEGWFHVAAGDSLPGDVKILNVEKLNNGVVVHTDKGLISAEQ